MNQKEVAEEMAKEALQHHTMLEDIRAICVTTSGLRFFKYLFRHFEVGELPPIGLEGSLLFDKLGFLRAGNSIFKIVAEASPDVAAKLLAEIEKDSYVIQKQNSIEDGRN